MRGTHWLAFFAALLVAWALLFAMAVPGDLRALEATYGAAFIEYLCGGALGASSFAGAFAMWALMSAAMMAPTALPAFATYDDLSNVAATGFGKLLGGYLLAWLGFSGLAAVLQVALFRAGLIGALGQSLSVPLTAALLIGAGAYQFSALKEACLSRCRAPLTFFMQHWDEGPFRNGLRMGLDCIGCCWALMLLGFVGGTMNLAFMGLAMILMTLEKLPEIGRFLTKPLGGVLIAAGLFLPFL
jgi:predicted metal-binding membrane protein